MDKHGIVGGFSVFCRRFSFFSAVFAASFFFPSKVSAREGDVLPRLSVGIGLADGGRGALSVAADTNQLDSKGRKQGFWHKKNPLSGLSYEGFFKDGMPCGRFVYRGEGDTLVAEAFYFRGGYASRNCFFYPSGQKMAEGYYLDKRKDSLWQYYAEDGRLLKSEWFENGLLDGTRVVYGPDADVAERQTWYRGLRNGPWYIHDQAGYQFFSYKLNLSHGPYLALYPDSTCFIEGRYDEGLKQGVWTFHLPGGDKYKEDSFADNRLVKRILYLRIEGSLREVSADTIALAMQSPRGGKAELLAFSGRRWLCDESFETVCGVLELDYFFYANKNTFVSYRAVDAAALEDALPPDDHPDVYDGQSELAAGLAGNAQATPVRLPLRVETPFPVYLDANGMDVLRNNLDRSEVKDE